MRARRLCACAGVILLMAATCGNLAAAEDEKKPGWSDNAEFSFVATAGNSQSSSLGLKNTAIRARDASTLTIRASALRVESQEGDRVARDDGAGGFVVIDPTSELTSENYALSGRFDRKISDSFFWFTGAGWDRNEPAGIENRYVVEAGLGTVWRDGDDLKFKTNYGVTYTKQVDVDMDPTVDETFFGARFAWDYLSKLTKTTTYTNVLVVDENLEQTSDWRADMQNGLSVAINSNMALKAGLQLLYDNEPALETLRLLDAGGIDTGTTVNVPLDELDTILTISLVVNFK